ncbi:multicopper oxidase domain-containing protein [Rothia sp. ZJ932]|uniref:multicopper oxidase domain-containing protein n=1 Tax=Rothia sp. ZJ932 TaxID=2810516 RepID=UPI001F071669|nr:multicopper oxidase domain-containing protein [Rothia sp. ZJ932]
MPENPAPLPNRRPLTLSAPGTQPADGPGMPVSETQAKDRASGRATWHRKASKPVSLWMIALFVALMVHRWVPDALWLMVHMVTLGLMTNSILIWSQHFTEALLKNRLPDSARGVQIRRIYMLNISTVVMMAGMLTAAFPLTVVGATGVGAVVAWHGFSLLQQVRSALPARFTSTVYFYIAASWLLPVGAVLGAFLAKGLSSDWYERTLLAHEAVNILGFVGLTVVGTLTTLWPTMLRTKMVANAVQLSLRGLYGMCAGLAVTVAGALAGSQWLAVAGLVLYCLALGVIGYLMVRTCTAKKPTEFATMSVSAGFIWLMVGVIWTAAMVATTSFEELNMRTVTPAFVVGFLVQVLLGAMSYLLPARMGGGPAAVRTANEEFNRFAAGRVVIVNLCLLVFVLPADVTGSWVRTTMSLLGAFTLFAFMPLMIRGVRRSVAKRKEMILARSRGEAPKPDPQALSPSPARHGRGAAIGAGAVALALVAGLLANPTVFSRGVESVSSVTPTGETTTVQVEATADMRFEPAAVEVPAGNRLVLEVTNTDAGNVHDLVLANGTSTGRIDPGATKTLDAGVVGQSLEGWCSVVGHQAMGMVFDVNVIGGEPADAGHSAHVGGQGASALLTTADLDLAKAPEGFEARSAVLEPLPEDAATKGTTVHRRTLEVEELNRPVAPGLEMQAWTFGGEIMGEPLRGKVGDIFEITLVNNGTMGHSIDFHAGMVSPDEPMRTIAPGESLVYRFEARGAGVWLYHCSTAPMSTHIAAGMYGAVIVEPENLEPVDREYVLVQSDTYLTDTDKTTDNGSTIAAVLPEAVAAGVPSLTTFNGYANQYVYDPLQAKVGERVRIWVLAAGPSKGMSFHVVGSQFDTVYKEGAYLLKQGEDALGSTDGHAQAINLAAAQGGFVEMEFLEAGSYTFVNHDFAEMERGARGVIEVGQ